MERQKHLCENIIGDRLTFAQRLIQHVIYQKQGSVIRENIHSDYADCARTGNKGKSTYIHCDYADFAK